jgi:hypothetical protein
MIGRRGLVKGVIGAVLLQACGTYYTGEGVSAAVTTDGQILSTSAAYFNQGGIGSRTAVKAYDSELADLINEVWKKEFGIDIDRHVYIQFVDSLPGGVLGLYEESREFDWDRMKEEREKQISIVSHMEPFLCYALINHELAHQWGEDESIACLTAYRNSTMSCIHYLQFGRDTGYGNFTIMHSDMRRLIDFNNYPGWDSHNIGALAALLALNEHNGSFSQAHNGLLTGAYWAKAYDFMERYWGADSLVNAVQVNPTDSSETPVQMAEHHIAASNLWNIVGLQVLKHNVLDNPGIDSATKTWLYPEMKLAARFQQTSNAGNSSGVVPSINPPQPNYYNGAVVPQDEILVPAGYNNDIPRGI